MNYGPTDLSISCHQVRVESINSKNPDMFDDQVHMISILQGIGTSMCETKRVARAFVMVVLMMAC